MCLAGKVPPGHVPNYLYVSGLLYMHPEKLKKIKLALLMPVVLVICYVVFVVGSSIIMRFIFQMKTPPNWWNQIAIPLKWGDENIEAVHYLFVLLDKIF